jgi:hypothetical protein
LKIKRNKIKKQEIKKKQENREGKINKKKKGKKKRNIKKGKKIPTPPISRKKKKGHPYPTAFSHTESYCR